MHRSSIRLLLGSLVALSLVAGAVGCSKDDDKSTNPGGGGGTLNIDIPSGGAGHFTFATAGTFPYKCSIHPAMTGSVVVEAGQPMSVTVDIQNSTATGFSPQSVHVSPGGTVHWTNSSGAHHIIVDNP